MQQPAVHHNQRRDMVTGMDGLFKAMFALSIVGALAGLALLVTTFVALTRNPKHRQPLLALATSAILFFVCRLLRAAHTLASHDYWEQNSEPSEFETLAAWTMADALVWVGIFVAVLLVLRDRGTGLLSTRMILLSSVVSIGLLVALAGSALGRAVAVGLYQGERPRLIAAVFSFLYMGIFSGLVIVIFSAAFVVRFVTTKSLCRRDKPTRAIVVGLLPIMMFQLLWVLTRAFIAGPLVISFPALIDEVVAVSLYPGIALTILIPGLHPTWWETLWLQTHRNARIRRDQPSAHESQVTTLNETYDQTDLKKQGE